MVATSLVVSSELNDDKCRVPSLEVDRICPVVNAGNFVV